MDSTPKTRELAGKIHTKIVENPDAHDQNAWLFGDDLVNYCGTTLCAAGWAIHLDRPELGVKAFEGMMGFFYRGQELLGLDFNEAYALFYMSDDAEARESLAAIHQGDEQKLHQILSDHLDRLVDWG